MELTQKLRHIFASLLVWSQLFNPFWPQFYLSVDHLFAVFHLTCFLSSTLLHSKGYLPHLTLPFNEALIFKTTEGKLSSLKHSGGTDSFFFFF